ncbi:Cloroperoxidase [Auriscalpium vulgare]|uniref:Cloroperoxidase n=1 Tax=Auriscalpium vulgare TaxID=40419 RepID=A0ACB8S394_9AGAM|nr:Cloroperoxidase [Auriscalpium vulgare]
MPALVLSHSHSRGECPVVGATRGFCPQQPSDVRSPCPALNTLANHGYLPRDGQELSAPVIANALEEGYSLSTTLANILSYGGKFLLGQKGAFNLADLARHNRIEHDASLAHDDAAPRNEYAPEKPDLERLAEFLAHSQNGVTLSVEEVAQARVDRESTLSTRLDRLHAEIARGEMSLVFQLFGGDEEMIPVETLRVWMSEERLPDGWKPHHVTGLLDTVHTSTALRNAMKRIVDANEGGEDAPANDGEQHAP